MKNKAKKVKQVAVSITPKNWRLSKRAADEHSPKTTRPKWINHAIEEHARAEGVK
jgi:hypothetical protein